MVQGNFRDFWKETEFFRLRDFVNRLQSEEGLGNPGDNEYMSSVYARVFQENVDSEAEELLDLNGASLEVLMVSDDECTEGEQQLDLPTAASKSSDKTTSSYPRRKIRRPTRLVSPIKKPDVSGATKRLPKKVGIRRNRAAETLRERSILYQTYL